MRFLASWGRKGKGGGRGRGEGVSPRVNTIIDVETVTYPPTTLNPSFPLLSPLFLPALSRSYHSPTRPLPVHPHLTSFLPFPLYLSPTHYLPSSPYHPPHPLPPCPFPLPTPTPLPLHPFPLLPFLTPAPSSFLPLLPLPISPPHSAFNPLPLGTCPATTDGPLLHRISRRPLRLAPPVVIVVLCPLSDGTVQDRTAALEIFTSACFIVSFIYFQDVQDIYIFFHLCEVRDLKGIDVLYGTGIC